jgi:hypothetical protein
MRIGTGAIVMLVAAVAQYGSGVAQSSAKPPAHIRNSSIPASRVERLLRHHTVTLTDVRVRGPFALVAGNKLDAKRTTFEGTVGGEGACEVCPPSVGRATFTAKDAIFKREVDLYGGPVFTTFDCERCVFKGFAYLFALEAESVDWSRSVFEDDVVLAAADITYFNVADAAFRKKVDLAGASISDFNTTRIRNSEPILIGWSELGGDRWAEGRVDWARYDDGSGERPKQVEAEFRFWKRNFDEVADKPAELKANYYLIKLNREFEFDPKHLDWWAAFFLAGPSEFGTKPFRPFIISGILILIFAVLYTFADFRHKDDENRRLSRRLRPIFAAFFSFDTFVPVVKLSGVGDWGWGLHGGWRWVGVAERALGVVLTAAAAYSVGTYVV